MKTDTSKAQPLTVIVIGASRGIGPAITRALLGRYSLRRIYATYRQQLTAGELLSLRDSRLHTHRLDVRNDNDINSLAELIRLNGDQPNFVIHCAGILHEPGVQAEKALAQCERSAVNRVFEVNSIGPLMVARAIIPLMPRRATAHFTALSAMVGSISDNRLGGWFAYRASKAALNQFMRTLSIECRRTHTGLCVTAIHPGTTDTALSRPFQANIESGKLYSPDQTAARILEVVNARIPEQSGQFVNWDGNLITP
jgi:NAD(P)-dependent dehydrogenase (short-subunit alcohol dehydrogenase family)